MVLRGLRDQQIAKFQEHKGLSSTALKLQCVLNCSEGFKVRHYTGVRAKGVEYSYFIFFR